MKRHNPTFDLVVLLPPMVYGPPLWQSKSSIPDLNESNLRVWNLFLKSSSHAPMPPNGVHHFVDVRVSLRSACTAPELMKSHLLKLLKDLADAHLQALLRPLAGNKRLIVSRGPVTSQQIADILRTNLSELEHRTPLGVPGANTLPKDAYLLDSETAADILGLAFRDIQDTFVDLGRYLLDSEKASK
jgi:nucleoside-diphosphate-sugar epimerase